MSRGRRWLLLYAALLVASHVVAFLREPEPPRSLADSTARVPSFGADGPRGGEVDLAYHDRSGEGPPLVLLHGSPGSSFDFSRFLRGLDPERRIIVPDLPGFGASERDVPDYSVTAHARYVLALLDELEIERVHIVGFSMGGGVGIALSGLAPERVLSLSLVSALGVVELELFGDHELNRVVHGAQLAILRALPHIVPHFGAIDGRFLGVPYARNFYDTDQRPLRGILERFEAPMLVVHGELDFLVPPEAAREHFRIVPQSRLEMLRASHFFVFGEEGPAAGLIRAFVDSVDRGEATTRSTADPPRVEQAGVPFDPAHIPPFGGPALLVALILIALATFVSEDLTCIGAGLLVAQGRISLAAGIGACFVGIFVGDVLLYLLGRWLGRPALARAPLSWFVRPGAVEGAAAWFRERGGRVVFLARFVPGTRLPTYLAAGILAQPFLVFTAWFVLAGLLWTPLFVWFASWAGVEARETFGLFERWALPGVIGLAVLLLLLQRLVVPLFSARGRRLFLGRYRRLTRWEFWPPYVFYLPVVAWIAWLALRHRSLAVATAVNPGIPLGGLVGESKAEILRALDASRVAGFAEIPASASADERRARARAFLSERSFPVVLKPDVGERGDGVMILRDEESLDRALLETTVDAILQEHVAGCEYGLFYVRTPEEKRGRVFSITEKRLPVVVGDGRRTLEDLILSDDRAVAVADAYFEANAGRLADVPAAGEEVRIVELGTHCRGAIFLDGVHLSTPELEEAVHELSLSCEGFHFGRYDVIAESEAALRAGEFRVIELNGLTSEATHVYDPRHSLLHAYGVLFEQWRLAFEIAAANAARGARPATVGEVVRAVVHHRRR